MVIEDEDYESDPEDAIVPMRRREASDEEEGERSERRRDRTAEIESDAESDGQGADPAYEEEEEEEYEEDEIVEEEEEEEIEGKEVGEEEKKDLESSRREEEEGEVEKKKENEPYSVPMVGAFYMHDNRFQVNGRGRNRRMPGGHRIWESKDDHAWVHDRFEEMNFQDTRYNKGRQNSRGRFRGCGGGRTRGTGCGFLKGNRYRGHYDDVNNQNRDGYNQNRDGSNRHREWKSVRGRGPRRYEPLPSNEVSSSQYKQPAKSHESTSNAPAGRPSSQTPNVQTDPGLPRKHAFGSNLNSASPPFYPSRKQDVSVNQKRDVQTRNTNKIISSSMQMENNFLTSQTGSMLRGKAVVDSVSHDRLYIDDSLHSVASSAFTIAQMPSSVSLLTSATTTHSSQTKVHGRSSSTSSQTNYQPIASRGQVTRITKPAVQQRSLGQTQPALRVSTQQMGQQLPVIGNQIPSPPHVSSKFFTEVIKTDSPPGSSKSKNQLVAKGKTGIQGAGRGSSFLYNGSQVIGASGAMGFSHNDQNFSATPALLPVMQFGGQHHGGLGVPAVGMALPGYVTQPQLGFGNSDMTWVPVLAGAAGALGASYPYIALDGNCYLRPPGQTSSAVASSRENSAPKPVNALKPPHRSEIVIDEFGQRQNKPRRYSEMNFGQ